MQSPSLQGSQSHSSLSQDPQQTEVLSHYLTDKFDWFANTVIDYIDEQDPAKRFGKMNAARIKETKDLRQHNKNLLQKVSELQQKLKGLKHSPSQSLPFPQAQHEPSASSATHIAHQLSRSTLEILPEQQRDHLKSIEQMDQHAKQTSNQEQQRMRSVGRHFEAICEKLARIVKFQKIIEGDSHNEETLTVTISKQKYELLLDFYCQGSPLLTKPNEESSQSQGQGQGSSPRQSEGSSPSQSQVSQFNAQKKQPAVEEWSADDLQKMFEALAARNNKSEHWKRYLTIKQTDSEQQLQSLKKLASSVPIKQKLASISQQKASLRVEQSLSANNQTLNTTASIKHEQHSLEEILFDKLKQLMKALNFSQPEYGLMIRLDNKRKCNMLYEVDEFLNKFQNKTDLYEISQAYTRYLLKTVNFALLNIMQLIAGSRVEDPQKQLQWFNQKLANKSRDVQTQLFNQLENQFTLYMQEKHKDKGAVGGKLQIKQILDVKFDKEKKLMNRLGKIVNEYKALFRSCIFNSNCQVNIKL